MTTTEPDPLLDDPSPPALLVEDLRPLLDAVDRVLRYNATIHTDACDQEIPVGPEWKCDCGIVALRVAVASLPESVRTTP